MASLGFDCFYLIFLKWNLSGGFLPDFNRSWVLLEVTWGDKHYPIIVPKPHYGRHSSGLVCFLCTDLPWLYYNLCNFFLPPLCIHWPLLWVFLWTACMNQCCWSSTAEYVLMWLNKKKIVSSALRVKRIIKSNPAHTVSPLILQYFVMKNPGIKSIFFPAISNEEPAQIYRSTLFSAVFHV